MIFHVFPPPTKIKFQIPFRSGRESEDHRFVNRKTIDMCCARQIMSVYFNLFILNFIAEAEITDCFENPVGVSDIAKIPDARMTSSSQYGDGYQAAYGRLNGDRGDGWCAKSKSGNNEWLQVDLGKLYTVCAVATQGDRNGNEWVTGFKLYYAENTNSWNVYKGKTGQDVVSVQHLEGRG